MKRQLRSSIAILFLVPLAATLAGCSGDSNVGSVRGTVTLNGKPVENAVVTFQPKQGGSPSHARTDGEGFYELRYTRSVAGAEIGEHTVRISTYRAANLDSDPPTELVPEYIPVAYNYDSKLQVDVKNGRNTFNFPLESSGSVPQPSQWR